MKQRKGKQLYRAGIILFIASLFLPVAGDSVSGRDEARYMSGIITQMGWFGCVFRTPAELSHAKWESEQSQDKGDGVKVYERQVVLAAARMATVILSSFVILGRLCAWSFVYYTSIRLLPLRTILATFMFLAAIFLATFLWKSSRTYVNGVIHLGIGGIAWVISLILVGSSFLYSSTIVTNEANNGQNHTGESIAGLPSG